MTTFKYHILIHAAEEGWTLFDDVLDEINACAIADEMVDCWEFNGKPIDGVRVIKKATNECVYQIPN